MVATTVGIRLRASVRGASTMTLVAPSRCRKSSVWSVAAPSNQLRLRNSTSISCPASWSPAHSRYSNALRSEDDVGRELHEHAAQLPGLLERPDGIREAAEDLGAELPRRALHAAAMVERDRVAKIRRQLLGLDRVPGHHPERLHVEHEALRRPPRPGGSRVRAREGVVAGVHLDRVEEAGVVAKPRLGASRAGRVPRLDQRLVSPGAGADADGGHRT